MFIITLYLIYCYFIFNNSNETPEECEICLENH